MRRQRGSFLGAALVILASAAGLAIAAAAGALTEWALQGRALAEAQAAEAAEALLADALRGATPPGVVVQSLGAGPPPPGYSLGPDGFASLHQVATATATGPRGVSVTLEQAWRSLGPAP